MKIIGSILFSFLFFSYTAQAQEMVLETEQNINFNKGRSIFIWQNNLGLIHLSKSENKQTLVTVYDQTLEEKQRLSAPENLLDKKYIQCLEQDGNLHFIFNQNKMTGIKNRAYIYDLTLSGKKLNTTRYKLPGAVNISQMRFENGKIALYGGDIYKKWDLPRVLKFGVSPFLFFTPLIIPKAPTLRPLMATLDGGKVELIHRSQFKKRAYKNKIIHDVVFNPDSTKWLAFTNGFKPGKVPLYLEKYDWNNTRTFQSKYSTNRKGRVSMFRFAAAETNTEIANFTIAFGNKVLAGPIILRGGIQSLTDVYEGDGGKVDGEDGTLRSVPAENYFGTANDPFSKDVTSSLEKKATAKFGDSIYDIFMSCQLMPLSQNTSNSSVLLGYYISAPHITARNRTSGYLRNFQIENPDPDKGKKTKNNSISRNMEARRVAALGHFCYTEFVTTDLFQAAVVQDSNTFYVCYIDPKDDLVSYSLEDNDLREVSRVTVNNALSKYDGRGSSCRLIGISETKVLAMVTEVPVPKIGAREANKKAKTSLQIYSLE